jgi:peptidoglycan/xylan/chitin deacetylase (PgdA/CDA1 family)
MDKYTVSPDSFAHQMGAIREWGWQPVRIETVMRDAIPRAPRRSLVISFDDGFASNRQHAWPILERYRFPSMTFVVTGRMGGYNDWDGPQRAMYPLLSKSDIADADPELMTFHSHSATHPDLTFLDPERLEKELHDPRSAMSHLATAGPFFAYPHGSWNWVVLQRVRKAGYVGACTSMDGLNSRRTNPFLLRRVEIRDSDLGWRFRAKLHLGRDITRWPPVRPPEVSILGRWLRWRLKSNRITRS